MTWADRYPATRLVAYDPRWPEQFREFAQPLTTALGEEWEIEHVGSTSVPGLPAKPVIDLAVAPTAAGDRTAADDAFERAGWTRPEELGDHRAAFLLDGTTRVAIAHVFTREQWPTAHVRLFARWLREHPEDRDSYARLKLGLVGDGVWGSDYTRAKRDFVVDVVDRARASAGLGRAEI